MTRARASAAPRPDGRAADELRPVSIQVGIAPSATGSALITVGSTQVICGVSIEDDLPRWMKQKRATGGWITSEYSMLPYSTRERARREVTQGRASGRTQEIQRLIGRALRAVTDLEVLGPRTAWIDCDVLQADGGTRVASVTGAYVAFRLALDRLLKAGVLSADPLREAVAAVSVGIVSGRPLLDLCYEEDAAASVDMNVVMTSSGRFVEVQGTAEEEPFGPADLNRMLKLAGKGIRALIARQHDALR